MARAKNLHFGIFTCLIFSISHWNIQTNGQELISQSHRCEDLNRYSLLDAKCEDTLSDHFQNLPPNVFDHDIMRHITCQYCTEYNLMCKHIMCTNSPGSMISCSDLAFALCDLCSHLNLSCGETFCGKDEEMLSQNEFISGTCDVCSASGHSCQEEATRRSWIEILDGPVWDTVLSDDMFTTYLIGEVEMGQWDGFLNHLTVPSASENFADASDT